MRLAFPVATPETQDLTILALRGELEESFRLLARLGYQGAELMVRDPIQLDPARIKAMADENNLAIPAVSTGQLRKEDGLQLCHTDPAGHSRALARTKEAIDFARAVGSPQINIGTLRGRLPDSEGRTDALAAARESMDHLLDYALERGAGIALEPQNRFVINWLNTVEETLNWIEQFKQPNVSILFDTYHALFEEASIYAALIRAFPRLSYIQIADSNRRAPGQGQVNFGELLRVLGALGYQGYVSVEVLPQPDATEAAAMSARVLLPLTFEWTVK